ncbi:histidine kinase [Streptomycetaceae bacterium NBC_01309]
MHVREIRDSVRSQVARILRPLVAALWRGTADPWEPRGWPPGLRGKWPFRRVSSRTAALGVDVLAALIILATTSTYLIDNVPSYSPNFLILTSAALSVPLILRHWHPLGAWRMSLLATLWTADRNWRGDQYVAGGVIVMLVILYTVAVRCERHITVGVAVVTVAPTWAIDQQSGFVAAILVLVPLLAGYNVRLRRAGARELEQREEMHREERAVLAERQRIAREMHDVVAHHMSVIAIQAEAAPYRVPDPDPVLAKSFADIRANALAGLADLRRILGVLREESAAPLTAPQPDLDRIAELVDNARGTGTEVTVEMSTAVGGAAGAAAGGPTDELPPAVGLAAYRIVQEALSNALKHAPGAAVHVSVTAEHDELRITVRNERPLAAAPTSDIPGPGSGGGHGLPGMRERATSLGGTFTAAPEPDGGFAVHATLPFTEDE